VSRLTDKSLEIACVALEYAAAEMRKQYAKTAVADLKTAADAQDAARKEIREFIESPVKP
jgi:hypothetical protein